MGRSEEEVREIRREMTPKPLIVFWCRTNHSAQRGKKMLIGVDDLIAYGIVAMDGEIGSLRGLFFDDNSWKIHYFIFDTGNWLPGRKVIISPQAVNRFDHQAKTIHVSLTREKIESSPEVDEDEPLSMDLQTRLDQYYNWSKSSTITGRTLQSTVDIIGSYIEADDGDIGHAEDFIVDDAIWVIRYMIVDTANWWPGKMVLISPRWIRFMKWEDRKVQIDLTREQIKSSPEYMPDQAPTRAYEERLYGHYGRSGYWMGDDISGRGPLP
jgi:hypothetical protein